MRRSGSERPWGREGTGMIWIEAARTSRVVDAAESAPMDSGEFTAFYERSARPLWAYLARVSGDPALAEDLMQEAFVRLLCATKPMEGEVHARRSLFKIATNLMRDHWRRPAARSIEEFPEMEFAAADELGGVE